MRWGISWCVSKVDKHVDDVDKWWEIMRCGDYLQPEMEELFEKQRKFGGKSVRLCKQSYAQGNPQRGELRVGINVWIMWIS